MSFAGMHRLKPGYQMAKSEIVTRTLNPLKRLAWRFILRHEVVAEWPTGWTKPHPAAGGGFIQVESADPNDHFRPWLEEHCGRQGWDWDWRLWTNGETMWTPGYSEPDRLLIRFRKESSAVWFRLTWG